MNRSSPLGATMAFVVWFLACCAVYLGINTYATRSVPVRVEDFRRPGMSDEQVISDAVQHAHETMPNAWWIHEKRAHLVFDGRRTYDVDPSTYGALDLRITTDEAESTIGVLRAYAK